MNANHTEQQQLIAAAVAQVRASLRATPRHARRGHWQIADRRIKTAALLIERNPAVAEQAASEAMFHAAFVTF